jgi:hypothetical protein
MYDTVWSAVIPVVVAIVLTNVPPLVALTLFWYHSTTMSVAVAAPEPELQLLKRKSTDEAIAPWQKFPPPDTELLAFGVYTVNPNRDCHAAHSKNVEKTFFKSTIVYNCRIKKCYML